jgi:ubiquitin-protein ligase
MSTVRLRRLQADFDKVREYIKGHPRVQLIQAEGTPPERYQLEYRIRGLRQTADDLSVVKSHMVEINLPLNYPRMPPQCRMLTPVFHPNIAPHAICIGDHWSPGEPLWSIVARIGEMIAYQSYNTKSPLNGEAARWVDQHVAELPLDPVSMMPDAEEAIGAGAGVAAAPSSSPPRVEPPPVPQAVSPPPLAAASAPATPQVRRLIGYLQDEAPPPVSASAPAPVLAGPVPAAPEGERRFACPHCGAIARWTPELAGKQLRCPRCRTVFRAPT